MKWLQWSTLDLKNGLGGVEVHARCLAKALNEMGHDAVLSSDNEDLKKEWDVVHTHGAAISPVALLSTYPHKKPIYVETLHGLVHERMLACREYFWPGGYKAAGVELLGIMKADVILSVHKELSFYKMIKQFGLKTTAVCSNGYDSWDKEENESLPEDLESKLNRAGDFWVFVGRGDDQVKDVEKIKYMMTAEKARLVAVPGIGFEDTDDVIKTPKLSSGQVRQVMLKSKGLLLTSKYEGLPLVVLEALGLGVPVVSTYVGGLKTLPPTLSGLMFSKTGGTASLLNQLHLAQKMDSSEVAQRKRATTNRQILKTWKEVAQVAVKSVEESMLKRK